jgi:hypothetical protein
MPGFDLFETLDIQPPKTSYVASETIIAGVRHSPIHDVSLHTHFFWGDLFLCSYVVV